MSSPFAEIFTAVLAWGEGRSRQEHHGSGTAAAVLTDSAAFAAASDSGLLADGTIALVPAEGASDLPGTVAYEGSLTEPGGEAVIADEIYLFTQDYSTSAYLSVIGPTLIRIFGDDDFQAFVEDADRARESGEFPDFLLAPAARLADLPGLGGSVEQAGPRNRVVIDGLGRVRSSPTGSELGGVELGLDVLDQEWRRRNAQDPEPCAVCLADAVPGPTRHTALSERPWMPEYLDAIDLMRDLTARGVSGLEVAGFGRRLIDLDPAAAPVRATALLAWNDDEAFVRDQRHGKTFRLHRDAAPAVDALLATGSVDAASASCPSVSVASAAEQLAAIGLYFPKHMEATHA